MMMKFFIYASLAINILVLIPVTYGLMTNASGSVAAFGADSPARSILLSVYLAILLCSAGLLLKPVPAMVAALLLVQIVYKSTTPFTVGSFIHPVVISNLVIAAFHSVTLWFIWRSTAPA
jgi:hypothetical protein